MQGTPIFLRVGPGGVLYPYYEGHFHGVIGGGASAVQIDAKERIGSLEVFAPEYYPDHLSFKVPPAPPSTGIRTLPRPVARIWGEYPSTTDPPAASDPKSKDRLVVGTGTDKNGKLLLDSAGNSDYLLDNAAVTPSLYFSGWGPYPGTIGVRCFKRGRLVFVVGIVTGAPVWRAGDVFFRVPWAPVQHNYISFSAYNSPTWSHGAAYVAAGTGDVTTYQGGTTNPPSWASFNFVYDTL